MAQNIKLISDSSCDFKTEEINKYNIEIIPFSCTFDDVTYLRENIDISQEEFYKKLEDPNVFAKTSLPSTNLYFEAFEKAVKNGDSVLCLCLSSALSGSYQSAINAKNMILEDYADAKVVVIDTLQASFTQGLLIEFAYELIQKGKSLEETEQIILKNRDNINLFLSVNSLKYLVKGGRISKAAGLAGDLLNVFPIIQMKKGALDNINKVRGQKKQVTSLVSYAVDFAKEKNYNIGDARVVVYHCVEDVTAIKEKAEAEGFNVSKIGTIGVTITAHTGPSIVGICVACFEE